MTEEEWLACTDPHLMLRYLKGPESLRTITHLGQSMTFPDWLQPIYSERKLRLFACACCRRLWQLLSTERLQKLFSAVGSVGATDNGASNDLNCGRMAVETAERFADGDASSEEMTAASTITEPSRLYRAAKGDVHGPDVWDLIATGKAIDVACKAGGTLHRLSSVAFHASQAIAFCREAQEGEQLATDEDAAQCLLIHDIFGNPFRPVTLDPSWLTPKVLSLAQGIYSDRAFDRMPILADALQDANCDNEEILNHCRGPGPHTRGCFVIDLALGKE